MLPGGSTDALSLLYRLDLFPKLKKEMKGKGTAAGGMVSVCMAVLILFLVMSNMSSQLGMEVVDHISVDVDREQRVKISLNVTLPTIACSFITLGVMDLTGRHQHDKYHEVFIARLDSDGNILEQGQADFLGEKIRESDLHEQHDTGDFNFRSGEGCRVWGDVEVNKVAGNFHFGPDEAFRRAYAQFTPEDAFRKGSFLLTHEIHSLSFGEDFPLQHDVLGGHQEQVSQEDGPVIFEYFLKVVPTVYRDVWGKEVFTNQYSATFHKSRVKNEDGRKLPGVYFMYEMSPLMVTFIETKKPFLHFLTQMCAIIGGAFAVSGMIDQFVHTSLQKMLPGKRQRDRSDSTRI